MKKIPSAYRNLLLFAACLALFIGELLLGPVRIPLDDVIRILFSGSHERESWTSIVVDSRLPRACASGVAGIGLALSGWLMQTLFRNPLAGPSVLGITSGASLGVAILILVSGGASYAAFGMGGNTAVTLAAITGAFVVLLLVVSVAERLADNTSLLVFGIMLGYFTSAIVSALQFKASNDSLKSFVLWGMGSFSEADFADTAFMLAAILCSTVIIGMLLKSLNLLLLGEEYAQSMGVNVRRTRILLILAVGLMAGTVTAFCGPVTFIGLVVPHMARSWMRTSEHVRLFVPITLAGAAVALLCDLLARLLGLPLNAVASALGAPMVIYIIMRGSRSKAII